MVRFALHTGLGGDSPDWNVPSYLHKFSQGLSTSVLPAASSLEVLSNARRVLFGISILLSTRGPGEQVVQGRSSLVQSPSAK